MEVAVTEVLFIFSQLREIAPQHPYLQDLDLKSSLFDRSASRFALVDSA